MLSTLGRRTADRSQGQVEIVYQHTRTSSNHTGGGEASSSRAGCVLVALNGLTEKGTSRSFSP